MLNMELLYDPAIPSLGKHLREQKTFVYTQICNVYLHQNLYRNVHGKIIYKSQKVETTQTFMEWLNGKKIDTMWPPRDGLLGNNIKE